MSRHLFSRQRLGFLLGLSLSLYSLSAGAATFTVINLKDSGPGSLRQAILDANVVAGNDTIVFQSGLNGTIILTSGQLVITSSIAINGPGANVLAISGNHASPVFWITKTTFDTCKGTVVSIDGLTIKDGNNTEVGGGIVNSGSMLTVSNSILSGNSAKYRGGGGIDSRAVMCEYRNSITIIGNLTVINSTLSGNSACRVPGSLYSLAGGIYVGDNSTATIINSTLSGNSACRVLGNLYSQAGGIYVGDNSTATIINSTLSGNSSQDAGGGIINSPGGTLILGNSIIAGNTALRGKELYNVKTGYLDSPPGVFISRGHNLFGENGFSGVEGATPAASDIVPRVGVDAILAPLGNYGGPTPTHSLVGSPAINAGDNALIPDGITTDQRGFPRIHDRTVDIGATELFESRTTMSPPDVAYRTPTKEATAVVRVLYATDRKRTSEAKPAEMFGNDRGTLSFGYCEVSIPHDHRMGELESPSKWRLEFREDPAKHVVLLSTVIRSKDEFFEDLATRVRASAKSSAFLFVHGYNVTFENAAKRTAQMSYDLAFEGAPVFYSWPSQGITPAYTVDEQMIEWAQANLKNFLEDFFERSDAQNVYLIAHSMGNRALTRAVASLLTDKPIIRGRLKEVILAAPDIDAEVFKRDIVPALTKTDSPVTLYASSEDLALAASKQVHGYPRAGDSGQGLVVVPGIETIDATRVDTGLLGHSYFAEARSILSDMFYLIRDGQRADQRFGLRRVDAQAGRYWEFKQ